MYALGETGQASLNICPELIAEHMDQASMQWSYRIRGTFGGDFNLAVW